MYKTDTCILCGKCVPEGTQYCYDCAQFVASKSNTSRNKKAIQNKAKDKKRRDREFE